MISPPDTSTLAGLTGAFRAGLSSGGLPAGVTARRADETSRRFAVYRNNVVHSLTEALKRRFPVVERLVGPEFFRALAPLYLAADPPSSPVLIRWGAGFPRVPGRVSAARRSATSCRLATLRSAQEE